MPQDFRCPAVAARRRPPLDPGRMRNMRLKRLLTWMLLCGLCLNGLPLRPALAQTKDYGAYATARDAALGALVTRMQAMRDGLTVYHDFSDTENHYTQKAKMWGMDANGPKNMDENWRDQPQAGDTCIRCEQSVGLSDWGGWLFLNGYLPEGEAVARLNEGLQPGQGLDLTGAEALRFWARGEQGGETVEFFTAGFGYDGQWGTQTVPYPDSAPKQTLGFVSLTKDWKEYVIPLKGLDLQNIACGFGFVLSGMNSGPGTHVFYLDEIRFTGPVASAGSAPMLLRSYDTQNPYIHNAAFSYDNALVAMALLSAGRKTEAAAILDAFVFAVAHDRQAPGRVRNAYAVGDLQPFAGWSGGVRMPGWYDPTAEVNGVWYEDRYQVGSNVGNTSYVALALLQYDAAEPNAQYLQTAATLMRWVLDTCQDGSDGFTAGFDGWAEADPPVIYPFTYKSIEHNIDAYAAFIQLYARTGEQAFADGAESALNLIRAMYDAKQGVFYTGTTEDGHTPSTQNIVLDAQVWAALALGERFAPYETSLTRVAKMRVGQGGYPFCESNVNGGWWAEGTAYTALLYRLRGQDQAAMQTLDALSGIQLPGGLFPAATVPDLATGFDLFDGSPWVYGQDAHIAPTAWFILAVNGFNPYAFD